MPYSRVLLGYLLYGMLQGPLGVLKGIPCGAIVGALRPPTSALRLIGGGTKGVLFLGRPIIIAHELRDLGEGHGDR